MDYKDWLHGLVMRVSLNDHLGCPKLDACRHERVAVVRTSGKILERFFTLGGGKLFVSRHLSPKFSREFLKVFVCRNAENGNRL
jgi:hypothetical protein